MQYSQFQCMKGTNAFSDIGSLWASSSNIYHCAHHNNSPQPKLICMKCSLWTSRRIVLHKSIGNRLCKWRRQQTRASALGIETHHSLFCHSNCSLESTNDCFSLIERIWCVRIVRWMETSKTSVYFDSFKAQKDEFFKKYSRVKCYTMNIKNRIAFEKVCFYNYIKILKN